MMTEINNNYDYVYDYVFINREQIKDLLNTAREIDTARELASREPKPEPHSEHYARNALEFHSYREEIDTAWERTFVFNLGFMEAALELEKDRKRLETTAKKLASRNSKPKLDSELLAKSALRAHKEGDQKECDKSLIYMGCYLKEEKRRSLASQNSNPGPDQPTLQTLREKRKEETLKEQEIQPQIKQGRSR